MKAWVGLVTLCLVALCMAEPLNNFVATAAEVEDLLKEGSKNCYLIQFVWKGEGKIKDAKTNKEKPGKEIQEAQDVQKVFDDYPECYWANLDVSRSDTKALLNSLRFENEKDNFSKGREITKEDTPMLLAVVQGKGYIASGPKPHAALKKELDALYRDHTKTDIEYEGKPPAQAPPA